MKRLLKVIFIIIKVAIITIYSIPIHFKRNNQTVNGHVETPSHKPYHRYSLTKQTYDTSNWAREGEIVHADLLYTGHTSHSLGDIFPAASEDTLMDEI